jgi:hypothetical protein
MSEEEMEQLKQDMAVLKTDFKEVKTALIGNAELKQRGLIHDVKDNSAYIRRDKKHKEKAVGIFVGVQSAIAALLTWMKFKL